MQNIIFSFEVDYGPNWVIYSSHLTCLHFKHKLEDLFNNLLSQSPDLEPTLPATGEDLFYIATYDPLRFPSTFTFVFRAFSTLE
ncbi:hypothetical protein Ccrd_022535, partial [Cynara cardunculus var. scolymus]